MPPTGEPDVLTKVRPIPPASIRVSFEDGASGVVDLESVSVDVAEFNLASVRVSKWKSSVTIDDNHGEPIDIDAAVLRALIDPDYAAKLRQSAVLRHYQPS